MDPHSLVKNPNSLYDPLQPGLSDLFVGGAASKVVFSVHPGGAEVSSHCILPSNFVLVVECALK
jgi:hypothetical protein